MPYYKASVIALNANIKDYPDTKYKEEVLYLITKANQLIAENSIESKQKERYESTIEAYNDLMEFYPASKYSKEAKRIYESASKKLEKLNKAPQNSDN